MLRRIVAITGSLSLAFPAVAAACPTCFGASSVGALRAYYASTIILSAMPFILIGAIALIAFASIRNASIHQTATQERTNSSEFGTHR